MPIFCPSYRRVVPQLREYRYCRTLQHLVIDSLWNSTALGNRLTGLPHNKEASRVVSFVYLFRQSRQRYQMFDALKYVLGPCF